MIKTAIIFALCTVALVLLMICGFLMDQNRRLRERLEETQDELALAPIPWGKKPDILIWEEDDDE